MANGKYLTLRDRLKLETMLKLRVSKKEICRELNICRTTLYYEIKRGTCLQIIKDKECYVYLADYAQTVADRNQKQKGRPAKIDKCPLSLVAFIEDCIGKKSYSPEVTAYYLEQNKEQFDGFTLCKGTIYNYLDKKLFKTISNDNLVVKCNKGKKPKKEKKVSYREKGIKYKSIEDRPEEAKTRETFGHWEMDTIYSGKGCSTAAGLVLTERKTRFEIIKMMCDRTMESVEKELDSIEKKLKDKFPEIFKTITVDNGVEFSQPDKIEKGIYGTERTQLFYCHAYCSGERGSNENINRMIRWFFPKGSDLGEYTQEETESVQDWLNDYPRKIHKFATPAELFRQELQKLDIDMELNF